MPIGDDESPSAVVPSAVHGERAVRVDPAVSSLGKVMFGDIANNELEGHFVVMLGSFVGFFGEGFCPVRGLLPRELIQVAGRFAESHFAFGMPQGGFDGAVEERRGLCFCCARVDAVGHDVQMSIGFVSMGD